MARKPSPFVCSACGAPTHKWAGRCPACGEWNTIATARPAPGAPSQGEKGPAARPVALSEIGEDGFDRVATGIAEFDM
nr:DNA repair protein RadA [Spirochaetota bacterium]